jgi:prepilin-type processing-associated H-X9-DG protein
MRDDLIGFVAGALDAPEHEEICRKMAHDDTLRQEVQRIQRCLSPLSWVREEVTPPAGLAARTCQCLAQWTVVADRSAAGRCDSEHSSDAAADRTEHESLTAALTPRPGWPSGWEASAGDRAAPSRQWTMADFVVAAGVCLAASCLFFPAIVNSRWRFQLQGCQNNMRELGTALIEYSGGPGGYFPLIPAQGPASVAGIYAPKLVAQGLVDDGRMFLCPAKGSTLVLRIPDMSEILRAQPPQLERLHRVMGGDYAYPLGYVSKGTLRGTRNRGQAQSALLGDAPLEHTRRVAIGTHGRGQNVLFHDGHVRFLTTRVRPDPEHPGDDLFFNADGLQQAGVDPEDYVLAASHVRPLPPSALPAAVGR